MAPPELPDEPGSFEPPPWLPDCEPLLLGKPAFAPPRLPDEDWLPPWLPLWPPLGDGIPDGKPEPPLPPEEEGEGMLGELRPPPELPPEEPLRPDDPPEEPLGGEDVGEGIDDDDCCWQPPIRSAEMALTVVTCNATTSSRFRR